MDIFRTIWEKLKVTRIAFKEYEEIYPEDNFRSDVGKTHNANRVQEEKSWCPFCGYSGSADDLRCHLLNNHRQ